MCVFYVKTLCGRFKQRHRRAFLNLLFSRMLHKFYNINIVFELSMRGIECLLCAHRKGYRACLESDQDEQHSLNPWGLGEDPIPTLLFVKLNPDSEARPSLVVDEHADITKDPTWLLCQSEKPYLELNLKANTVDGDAVTDVSDVRDISASFDTAGEYLVCFKRPGWNHAVPVETIIVKSNEMLYIGLGVGAGMFK